MELVLNNKSRNQMEEKIRNSFANGMDDRAVFMKRQAILAHLRDVEEAYGVKILLAVESGSRAWGFESKNSDWDVRFIYVHTPEWYFNLKEQRDVIEHMYDDDVDLVGWELRKALMLLSRGNPSLLEWFSSPIVYYEDQEFLRRIREVESFYFNPIRGMYHYYRIYNVHNERYLTKEGCTAKRFLYYLRGVLACRWIEKNLTLPPVAFGELVEAVVDAEETRLQIDQLLRMKKSGNEYDIQCVDAQLRSYARQLADYYDATIGSFHPELQKISNDKLNALFYDMVMAHAGESRGLSKVS